MTNQFLYPTSNQYPIDSVCGAIVRALEARNFDVPGLRVEFHVYGSGEQRMRCVGAVHGNSFSISFGRSQGTLPGGHWNDTAAIRCVTIPRKRLTVYADASLPSFYLYVGEDWSRDFAEFAGGLMPGVNSKLRGKPRNYLCYRGNYAGECGYGPRASMLLHDHDLEREYSPEGDDPHEFVTAEVFAEFVSYLRDVVLAMIEAHPEVSERVDLFSEPEPIPVPPWAASLFCFGGHRDVARIRQGQQDASKLDAAKRYAMQGSGWRLASLDVRNDGTVPEVAYDGFLWCGIPWADGGLSPTPPIPGNTRGFDNNHVIRIRLKTANEIYIADHGAYEQRRAELAALSPERSRFTDAEVSDFMCARARTIVPIHEYKGGFSQPVVLVRRELGFDEVEIIGEG